VTGTSAQAKSGRSLGRTFERLVLVCLLSLGATTIVSTAWARDYAEPRATLLGSDRGISVLVTSGAARVLIVNGSDPAALGNAISKSRHPGLDRLDLMIVSGNAAAAQLVPRAIDILQPRAVMTIGTPASLEGTSIEPMKVIDRATAIELPDGVTITIDVWPAAGGENDDVTWSATIRRGSAALYWVADREALMPEYLPEGVDVTVFGRGAPTDDTPLPISRVVVAAGESISGPELRATVLDPQMPDIETKRVFAGETVRIDLDLEGIRSVSGAIPAASPVAA
jgi:hypothetical protein